MSLNIFKRASKSPLSSSKESEDGFDRAAYERRRQQVRKAQRNHRERKANYLKALEQEVGNLRKQNQHNIREYEEEIQMLHTYIVQLGQNPPARQARIINPVNLDPNSASSYTVSKPPGLGQALHFEMPMDLSGGQGSSLQPHRAQITDPSGGLSVPSTSGGAGADFAFGSDADGLLSQTPGNMMDRMHGINFVLTLEHTCMGHPDETRLEFGAHSHMATANLLEFAPTNVSAAVSWEVPGASIERLLALSTEFKLQGEITPVQAWFRLKQHPRFGALSRAKLDRLCNLVVPDSKCYGFGAVLDEQLWHIAVEEVMKSAV